MKPHLDGFAVVTAGTITSPELDACVDSWRTRARYQWPIYHVHDVYGSVPAFAKGVAEALDGGAQIIACLHNDLRIDEDGWDALVWSTFQHSPSIGLLGFGGAKGLGAADIYETPYSPYQLARQDFVSNMQDAKAHGRRSRVAEQVACLDGFSQIGRAEFWGGLGRGLRLVNGARPVRSLFDFMADAGVVHHFYDGALGAYAARLQWDVLMLPIACHHLGGRTAVGDAAYHEWAADQPDGSDAGFWVRAHEWGYAEFRDVLPIRVP